MADEVPGVCRFQQVPLPREPFVLIRVPRCSRGCESLRRALEEVGVEPSVAAAHAGLLGACSILGRNGTGNFGFAQAISILPAHESIFGDTVVRWTVDVFNPSDCGLQLQGEDAKHDYYVMFFSPIVVPNPGTGIADCHVGMMVNPDYVEAVLRGVVAPICATVGSDFAFGTSTAFLRDVLTCIQLHSFPYSASYVPLTRYLWGWSFYSEAMAEELGVDEVSATEAGLAFQRVEGRSILLWRDSQWLGEAATNDWEYDQFLHEQWLDWYQQAGMLGMYFPGHVRWPTGFQSVRMGNDESGYGTMPAVDCRAPAGDAIFGDVVGRMSLQDMRQLGVVDNGAHLFAGPGEGELSIFSFGSVLTAISLQYGAGDRVLLDLGVLGGSWSPNAGALVAEIRCGHRTQLVIRRGNPPLVEVLLGEDRTSSDGSIKNDDAALWCCRPRMAPDGSRVVFTSPRLEILEDELICNLSGVNIMVVDVVTRETRVLVASPEGDVLLKPVWSPDSSHVAYIHYTRAGGPFWTRCWFVVCDLEGEEVVRYSLPSIVYSVDWAASSSRVVMAMTDEPGELFYGDIQTTEGGRLVVVDVAEGSLEYLSDHVESLSEVTWMLDSEQIAFLCSGCGMTDRMLCVGRYRPSGNKQLLSRC